LERLEHQFQYAMTGVYENSKDIDYYAHTFKRMLDQYGGVETAKMLLSTQETSEGLMELSDLEKLDQSMEALVVQERFQSLFSSKEIKEAHRRLEKLRYFEEE